MFLKDELITLRAIEKEDGYLLLDMINDPEMEASVVGWSYPVSKEQQDAWINNLQNDKTIRFAIDNGSGFVGVTMISSVDPKNKTANLNIKILKAMRGKGYASRTIRLIIEYCFNELNLNCLTANVIEENNGSRRLWERAGFIADGILRSRVYKAGRYKNIVAYSLLKDDYIASDYKALDK